MWLTQALNKQKEEGEREVNLSVTNRSITWEILGEKEIPPFLFVCAVNMVHYLPSDLEMGFY